MMRHPIFTVALGLLLLAAGAAAQDITKFDRDGDGRMSKAERRVYFLHQASPVLREVDADFDGKLSAEESKKQMARANLQADAAELLWNEDHPACLQFKTLLF